MGHHFDTHSIVKRFVKSGIKESQAEEIVKAIAESREFDISHLATKADLHQEIGNLRADMLKWGIGMVITTIFGMAGVMIAVLKIML